MPLAAIRAYYTELPARRAEMQLLFSEVVALPWMEERDRRNLIERWQRLADGRKTIQPPRAALALIGIRIVDVEMKDVIHG